MNSALRQKHWADAQERILLGVAEPEDQAVVQQVKHIAKHRFVQEGVTLLAILLFVFEFVAVLAVCFRGALWLH